MSSVVEVNIEKENFLEFGSYLHRTTPAVTELQVTENVPSSTTETLRSLAAKVDIAKELVEKCNSGAKSISASELKSTIEQIEWVVNSIGQDIGTIPSNIFQNKKYAGTAIQSLAKEMQNAQFNTNPSSKNSMEGEQDLYQVQTSKEESKTIDDNIGNGEMPRLKDFLKGMYYHGKNIPPSKTLNQLAEHIEPLYEAFFCPLTKKVMDDPVTIETGVTYERNTIRKWFENLMDKSQDIVCPVTKQKLHSRVLNTNLALKTMITEWKERNEASRMRVAQTALSLASSASVVLDAIRDLEDLCTRREHNKLKMHNFGVTKILTHFLEYDDRDVRCETSKVLRCLAEDDRGKEIIAKTRAITAAVKMLSSDHLQEKHASVSLLLQLSRHEQICRNIGATPGAILMIEGLVGILLRFTTTLYDHEILQMAKEQNLSSETVNLSKPAMEQRGSTKMAKFLPRVFSLGSRRERRVKPCPVHRGACSPSTTFCLLESNALGKLVRCLQHENGRVVEAALSAICTMLDEKVDVERSVEVLSGMELVEQVVSVLRKHKEDGIWQKAFWVIERFVARNGEEMYGDEQLSEVLLDACQHGNSSSKQVAQNMLSHFKRKSNLPRNFTAV